MAALVQPITQVPEAFSDVGAKLNEAIRVLQAFQQMTGTSPINVNIADGNVRVSIDPLALSGGAGLPAGYTFEEFTICDSGSPATRWWPTWLTNPEA